MQYADGKKTKGPNIELANMYECHGCASFILGQYEKADHSYKQAVHIFQIKRSEHEEDLARVMMKRGDLMLMRDRARAK
eukprot:3140057-Ditylum_brightwellii.AAC.1